LDILLPDESRGVRHHIGGLTYTRKAGDGEQALKQHGLLSSSENRKWAFAISIAGGVIGRDIFRLGRHFDVLFLMIRDVKLAENTTRGETQMALCNIRGVGD
jgi:hypothetical protein